MKTTTISAGIQRGTVYPISDFEQLAKKGRHAMRSARRDGLRVIRKGGRAYVSGDDFFDDDILPLPTMEW